MLCVRWLHDFATGGILDGLRGHQHKQDLAGLVELVDPCLIFGGDFTCDQQAVS
jgi:hypothetical protein